MSVEQTKTIRQAVFDNDCVWKATHRLNELPIEILNIKESIVDLEDKLKYDTAVKDAKQAVTDLEVEVAYEVKNELWVHTNPDLPNEKKVGAARFSNPDLRKDETRRRLAISEYYIGLKNNVGLALRAQSVIEMDRGKAHARLAAIEAENHNLRSIAAMIAGLAHESTTNTTHRHTTTMKIGEN